jgi:two-component system nitrogen regulation response regulator NtrX
MQKKHGASASLGCNGIDRDIECAIRSDVNVLISGGDDRRRLSLAHVLHQRTRRMDEPFVVVERDRLSEVRGGWKFPTGGTLFIEEVGDLSPKMQAELMVFLDGCSAQSKGGRVHHFCRTRVVAATTYNLFEHMAKQNFREDLFYRLNVIPFVVPPLRERKEDIPLLARHFLKEFASAYGRRLREISDDAIAALMRYTWPGNVRELRNVIERIVIMNPTTSRFERKHLPPLVYRDGSRRAAGTEGSTLHQARAAYERDYILKKLDENHGNVSRTAEVLGLERSHLYRKMKSLGIAAKE